MGVTMLCIRKLDRGLDFGPPAPNPTAISARGSEPRRGASRRRRALDGQPDARFPGLSPRPFTATGVFYPQTKTRREVRRDFKNRKKYDRSAAAIYFCQVRFLWRLDFKRFLRLCLFIFKRRFFFRLPMVV